MKSWIQIDCVFFLERRNDLVVFHVKQKNEHGSERSLERALNLFLVSNLNGQRVVLKINEGEEWNELLRCQEIGFIQSKAR